MVAFIVSIGLLIGLMFKRKEHPTNMYLLFAFVSCIFDNHINKIISIIFDMQSFTTEQFCAV